MDIVYTIDDKFVRQFLTSATSLVKNSKKKDINIYLVSKEELKEIERIKKYADKVGFNLIPTIIGEEYFSEAPADERYPVSIYYRLLAHEYLPQSLDRALYIDADTLIINDISPLLDLDFGGKVYGAASTFEVVDLKAPINRIRLGEKSIDTYYNSGVLMMNLEVLRQIDPKDKIYEYIEKKGSQLILPDQDVLNVLYANDIVEIPAEVYNFDSRMLSLYKLTTSNKIDMDWVMQNTVVIHFCGKIDNNKPWNPKSKNKFASLYKHYWTKVINLYESL